MGYNAQRGDKLNITRKIFHNHHSLIAYIKI